MDFFTGGGFLGNLIRGIGQRFGLGKRFNEPTYDMSRFNKLGLGGIDPFANLDIRDIYDRRKTDEEETDTSLGKIIMEARANNSLRRNPDDDYLGPNLNEGIFMDYQELDESGIGSKPKFGGTVLYDEFPSTRLPDMRDLGNPYADPRIVPEERGLEPGPTPFTLEDRIREEQSKLGIGSDKMRDIKENYLLEAGNQGIMSVPRSDIDPQFQDMVRQVAMNEAQKKKALQEMEFGVAPEKIMPKLQQLDDTKFFMKTDDRITSNDLIKFYEDRGIKLSDEQKMKIVRAAGEDV
jgi:hypothetical protein